MIPVNGAPMPQRKSGVHWVEQVPAGDRQQWRIWSKSVWSVWTHFNADRSTSPCYEDHTHCADQHDPTTLRWKGYVMGWSFKRNKAGFIQLTQHAIDGWNNQLGVDVPIRGSTIFVARTAKRNGRLVIETCPHQSHDPGSVPVDVDPRASLFNMWKLHDHGWAFATSPRRDWDGEEFLKIAAG